MTDNDSSQKNAGSQLTTIPLKNLSFARFEGPDASSFLQTQLSADIAALEPGDATYACYCSPRGQVFGLLLVCREDACFNVVAASHLLPGILKRLKMYVMRAKVEISEPPAMQVCGVTGSDIDSVPTPCCREFAPWA